MPTRNNIQIVFAHLPEEERDVERSAAKEFALRTAEIVRDEARAAGGDARCDVKISPLAEWKKDQLFAPTAPLSPNDESDDNNVINTQNTTVVFLISCGPDGSVHRSVRKTTKWIKEQENKIKSDDKGNESDKSPTTTTTTTCVVALLGHSVCKTSAEQMEDEVFSAGRRLAKSLQGFMAATQSSFQPPTATTQKFVLETHVELEPPEEKFDGWVESWASLLQK